MAAFIGQGPSMRTFDQQVKQQITVCFVQRHISGAWKCLRMYFKDSMPQTLNISHTFENPAFS